MVEYAVLQTTPAYLQGDPIFGLPYLMWIVVLVASLSVIYYKLRRAKK